MSAIAASRESQLPLVAAEPLVSIRELLRDSQNGLSKRQGHSGEPVPVLRLANVVDGAIDESDAREIRLTEREIAKYALEPGDLLCIRVNGSRNLVGRVVPFAAQRRWAYCDHFIRLRPDRTRVDSRYLAHYLNTRAARRQIELNMVSSAGQNTVSQGTMLDIHVPLPALARQRAVVAELEKQFSRLDEAIADLKRVKANLKHYKAAVLNAAVEGRLVPTDAEIAREGQRPFLSGTGLLADVLQRRREQRAGRGKYKEPALVAESIDTAVPGGWTAATLNQLTTQIADVDHKMPRAVDHGIPYVSTNDFTDDDTIDFDGAKRISREDFEALSRKVKPARGDILLSRYGTVGEVRAVETDVPFQASYRVAIIKPVRGVGLADYLKIVLRSDAVQAQIKRDVRATAQPDLGLAHIREFVVPLPPASEQRRIVAEVDRRLSIISEVKAEVDANLKRAEALRSAILAGAFRLQ